jgi:L-iditol 2-dehydrogenase
MAEGSSVGAGESIPPPDGVFGRPECREGDRVVIATAAIISPDNPMNRRGPYNLDPTHKGFGYGVDGAMTRFVRGPDRLPFELAPGSKKEVAARDAPQP